MIKLDDKYFRKFEFTKEQVNRYFTNANRDLEIAKENSRNEVKFSYSYSSLIKAGIALIAAKASAKVRSIPGHHIKILETMSDILKDETVFIMGNAMRMKINDDFYGEGIFISDKEAQEYLAFIEKVIRKVKKEL
ncbi:MAG: hypothetical protein ABH859_02680 [Pseudomonadota bacterium]